MDTLIAAGAITLYVDAFWESPFDCSCYVALREKAVHPYGNGVGVSHTTGFVRTRHEDDDAARLEEDQSEPYGIAGRVVATVRFRYGTTPYGIATTVWRLRPPA